MLPNLTAMLKVSNDYGSIGVSFLESYLNSGAKGTYLNGLDVDTTTLYAIEKYYTDNKLKGIMILDSIENGHVLAHASYDDIKYEFDIQS